MALITIVTGEKGQCSRFYKVVPPSYKLALNSYKLVFKHTCIDISTINQSDHSDMELICTNLANELHRVGHHNLHISTTQIRPPAVNLRHSARREFAGSIPRQRPGDVDQYKKGNFQRENPQHCHQKPGDKTSRPSRYQY